MGDTRVVLVIIGAALAVTGATAQASTNNQSVAVQRLCVHAFPSANQRTVGRTTFYNRQASVEAIACEGFGFDTKLHVDGGVICSLVSAAIGIKYDKYTLFIDGGCSAAALRKSHDVGTESAAACSMLSDLLGKIPWAKAYAIGAGVACAFGNPIGSWIESESEHQAARGVIKKGKCLKFARHKFPLTDNWAGIRCDPHDEGFHTLPTGPTPRKIMCDMFGVAYAIGTTCAVERRVSKLYAAECVPASYQQGRLPPCNKRLVGFLCHPTGDVYAVVNCVNGRRRVGLHLAE